MHAFLITNRFVPSDHQCYRYQIVHRLRPFTPSVSRGSWSHTMRLCQLHVVVFIEDRGKIANVIGQGRLFLLLRHRRVLSE